VGYDASMTRTYVRKLMKVGLVQSLHPIKSHPTLLKEYNVGLDMEYEQEYLYTVQISYNGTARYYKRLVITLEELYDLAYELILEIDGDFEVQERKFDDGSVSYIPWRINLWSYWDNAEVSHIANVLEDGRIGKSGANSYIVTSTFGEDILYRIQKKEKNNEGLLVDLEKKDWIHHTVGQKRIKILDLWAHFKGSLAKLAKAFGEEKMEWPWEDKSNPASSTKWCIEHPEFRYKGHSFEEYAVHDAYLVDVILRKYREEMFEETGLDVLRLKTPAALGMSHFRTKYLDCDIVQTDAKLRKLALQCPHGARSTSFNLNTEGLDNEFDYTSLYGASGITLEKLPRVEDWVTYDNVGLVQDPKIMGGLFDVRFKFPSDTKYPHIRVETDTDGTWDEPLEGRAPGVSYSELCVAQDMGCQIEVMYGKVYYDGTTSWAEFCKDMELQKEYYSQEETYDLIRRTIFKNLLTNTTGRLYKHKGGFDIEMAKTLARERGWPLEIVLGSDHVDGFPVTQHCTSLRPDKKCWMPEWHALILGEAMAHLQKMILISVNPKGCSTDAVLCEGIEGELQVPFVAKYKEPMYAISFRTKLYILLPEEGMRAYEAGELLPWLEDENNNKRWKIARHAYHDGSLQGVVNLLEANETELEYTANRIGSLRTAYRQSSRDDIVWGGNYDQKMSVSLLWDEKRELLLDGTTRPWATIDEYVIARQSRQKDVGKTVHRSKPNKIEHMNRREVILSMPGAYYDGKKWQSDYYDESLTPSENAKKTEIEDIKQGRV